MTRTKNPARQGGGGSDDWPRGRGITATGAEGPADLADLLGGGSALAVEAHGGT
jgi:hypothetical protein